MARRPVPSLAAKKMKKVKLTFTETQLINSKYMGDEPLFQSTSFLDDIAYGRAQNWYHYMCTRDDARKYLDAYLRNVNRTEDAKKMKNVSDTWFPVNAGWIARMITRGAKLPEVRYEQLDRYIKESYKHLKDKEELKSEEVKEKPSIQDRITDRVSDFIAMFEKMIDTSGWSVSMYETLQKHELPPNLALRVAEYYKPIADEAVILASKGCPASLAEGYSYTKEQHKERSTFYTSVVSDAEKYSSNTKKKNVQIRKPRPVSLDKKLKNVKYLKESKEFKLVSIAPEKLVGAQEFWLFNTRYKTATVFYALDRGGLDVKGVTITKYDENKSKTFRFGRKADDLLTKLQNGGKRVLDKLMKELNVGALQKRINEDTILLKAI